MLPPSAETSSGNKVVMFFMIVVMMLCLALILVVLVDGRTTQDSVRAATEVSALSVERTGLERVPADIDPATVLSVSAIACDTSQQGSAFVSDSGLYTAGHVVGDAEVAFLTPHRSESVFSTVEGRPGSGEDAARLFVEDLDIEGLVTTDVIPERGETATIAGYPLGGPLSIVAGEMLGLGDGLIFGMKAKHVIMVDVHTEEGFSGGPVVNAQGEVFGVVVAMEVGTDTALAIPLADLEFSEFVKHDCGPTSTLSR